LHSFQKHEIILVKIETEEKKGSPMKSKKIPLELAYRRAVCRETFAKFSAYLSENGQAPTRTEEMRLVKATALVFLTAQVDEIVQEGYVAGTAIEVVAQKLFLSSFVTRELKKTWGFKKKFETARMMSAARYAASPESEAYWAS